MTNATATSVNSSASTVRLLAAKPSRVGAIIANYSTATLSIVLGGTATVAGAHKTLAPLSGTSVSTWEVPFGYTGEISGIWSAANGTANIVEMA